MAGRLVNLKRWREGWSFPSRLVGKTSRVLLRRRKESTLSDEEIRPDEEEVEGHGGVMGPTAGAPTAGGPTAGEPTAGRDEEADVEGHGSVMGPSPQGPAPQSPSAL